MLMKDGVRQRQGRGTRMVRFKLAVSVALILSFFTASSLLAQQQGSERGELRGGGSQSYTIQLKVGEMVQGELIAVRNQTVALSLADNSGEVIRRFGATSSRGGFKYAAKADGQYYLVVENPDSFSVGTRGYQLLWEVKQADVAPGSGSGSAPGRSAWFWMEIGLILAAVLAAVLIGGVHLWRWRTRRENAEAEARELFSKSPAQLEAEIARIRRRKRELEHRLEILSKARRKIVISERESEPHDDVESEIGHINFELYRLDIEEEKLARVLSFKQSQRN
jgi:hypothetical protein